MQKQSNDILTGSVPRQLLVFFMPIWFGTLFQQLYNTVDTLVVGNFVGTGALAAVGATGVFVSLMVGIFTGLCSGAGILISQSYGAGDTAGVKRRVHTGLVLAAVGGLGLTALGLVFSRPALLWLNTPADIVEDAVRYLSIYFVGMAPQMLYNMGTGILRAVGDSKRPLRFLIVSSFVNMGLDLLFVARLGWGVAGAAWATVLSQGVSAALTLRCLAADAGQPWQLRGRDLRLDGKTLYAICCIGLPTAAQSALYSISNLAVQGAINQFGTTVVAAWSVYGKIDFVFWMTMFAMGTSITTFCGQNFGARQYDRVRQGGWVGLGLTGGMTLAMMALMYPSARWLFRLFTPDAAVVDQGVQLMCFLVPAYILWFSVEVFSGVLRGCGDVKIPTLITVLGACVLRIAWIRWAVPVWPTVITVEAGYPLTWAFVSLLFWLYYLFGHWLDRRIAAQTREKQTA